MPNDAATTRVLVWDDLDMHTTLASVLVDEPGGVPEIDLEAVFLWLDARCQGDEAPDAYLFTTVDPGREADEWRASPTIRTKGFGAVVAARPARRRLGAPDRAAAAPRRHDAHQRQRGRGDRRLPRRRPARRPPPGHRRRTGDGHRAGLPGAGAVRRGQPPPALRRPRGGPRRLRRPAAPHEPLRPDRRGPGRCRLCGAHAARPPRRTRHAPDWTSWPRPSRPDRPERPGRGRPLAERSRTRQPRRQRTPARRPATRAPRRGDATRRPSTASAACRSRRSPPPPRRRAAQPGHRAALRHPGPRSVPPRPRRRPRPRHPVA